MVYSFLDSKSKGVFYLHMQEPKIDVRYNRQKNTISYYTLVYNTGSKQIATIDGLSVYLPAFGILPLMFNQSYAFENPEHIVMWRFNRDFYCIVNHDKEVGCAGFLFYGSWGQIVLETNADQRRKLELLIEVFKDEFGDKDDIQGDMLRMLLVRLIITITRIAREQLLYTKKVEEPKLDLIRQYNMLVETHFKEKHEVQFYAAQLFKVPKTLANVFAKYGSRTPLEIIHDRIAMEARRLLVYSELSIKEIALQLGFEDAGHFSRFVKNQLGQPPMAFKKNRLVPEIPQNGQIPEHK